MAIDILTKTGLRLFELCNLRCGDLRLGYGESSLIVRDGKCSLSGSVIFDECLKRHFKQFLKHKEQRDEPTEEDDFLFCSQRQECWSRQAVQHIVKRMMRETGIYRKGASVHALRHSYAFQLYAVENNIRAVQKQLRHRSIRSTTIYADVSRESIKEQVTNLWR